MEGDALLVQKDTLEEILASVNRRSHSGARTLLETMLNLCPTVNRQAASAAEHLVDALEGLMEGLNQDDYDTWFLHRDAEPFINAAELALLMAYGDTGRGEIGTSVTHQLKDANAAVAISHEQIEELFALLREMHGVLDRSRQLMEDTGAFRLTAGYELEPAVLDIMTRAEARLGDSSGTVREEWRGLSPKDAEALFAILRETQKAISWGREVLSSSPILTATFNRIFADVEEKVEAKLCME